MKEELKIFVEVKKWLFDLEDILINFPRKSIVFQNKIYDTSFSLLQHLLESNIEKECIKYCFIDVSILNTYIEYSYVKKYISKKMESRLSYQLQNILKMLYGLKRYYEV